MAPSHASDERRARTYKLKKQVRVADVDGPQDADCSDEFYLMTSAEAPVVGGPDAPYLMVTSPSTGDMAQAGAEYTVEVSFLLCF